MDRDTARELLASLDRLLASPISPEQRTTLGLVLDEQVPDSDIRAAFRDAAGEPLIGVVTDSDLYLVSLLESSGDGKPGAECAIVPLTSGRVVLGQRFAKDDRFNAILRHWRFELDAFGLEFHTTQYYGDSAPADEALARGLAAAIRAR